MGFEIEDGVLYRYDEEQGVTSVTIPDSVTSIGRWAFYDCSSLTSINVDKNNKNYSSSDGVLYNKNLTELVCCPGGKTSVTIPDSVTSIGDGAFSGCRNLTSVTIPDSVTSIGDGAFSECRNLTSVTIPDSVTEIGWHAFEGYNSLKSKQANYKAFDIIDNDIRCMDYTFKPNEWTEEISEIKLCEKGYHFCTNLFEIFNYYSGIIDKNIAIYECEVGNKVIHDKNSSKCVTNKIKPVKRLYQKDVIRILNSKEGESSE